MHVNDYNSLMAKGSYHMEHGEFTSASIELRKAMDLVISNQEALRFTAGMLYNALVFRAVFMKKAYDRTANEHYLYQSRKSLEEAVCVAAYNLDEIKESAARIRLADLDKV